ncbi:ATP-binding protein [Streptomyces abikoensis]|uniref:ATP-binding protein n=1 Tax=Streptomyces abikoensis TaxID=97398 RepID=UPI003710BDDB
MRRVLATAALAVAALGAGAVGPGATAYAAPLPNGVDLKGVTMADPGNLGSAVDEAAQKSTRVIGDAGGGAVGRVVPAAGRTGGTAVKSSTSAVQQTIGRAAGSAGEAVGETAKAATKDGPPFGRLASGGLGHLPS